MERNITKLGSIAVEHLADTDSLEIIQDDTRISLSADDIERLKKYLNEVYPEL